MTASDESLHSTATDLRLATFRLARRLRRERAVDAMSDAQLAILAGLRMHGRQTITGLAERERVAAPSMTSTINSLEMQGHVVRVPDVADRRRVYVELTASGAEVVAETIRRRDALLADALAELGFTEEELTTLRAASALMQRMSDR